MTVKNTKKIKPVNEYPCDLMERTEDGMGVVKKGEHIYYNLDGKVKMSDWVRGELRPRSVRLFRPQVSRKQVV